MKIECCHHCEKRHEKCHAHFETYLTQKMLKILVEASASKEHRVSRSVAEQKYRMMDKVEHYRHLRRRK